MTLERVNSGVKGLDEMMGGGFPRGHVVAVLGSFGTGKTTFALQFIEHGLSSGEKAIFISLEEDEGSVLGTAESFGWELQGHVDAGDLHIVRLSPEDMNTSIQRVKNDLPAKIRQFGAQRVAMDSVSLFTMLFESPTQQRNALFQLASTIRSSGATSVFTAEVAPSGSSSRDGLVEYVADGVIILKFRESESTGDVKPVIQILKMRRSDHIRVMKPYTLSSSGLAVHPESSIF